MLAAALTVSSALAAPFNTLLERQGMRVEVTCPNEGSLNMLTLRFAGLALDNRTIQQEVDGSVTGAHLADLDGNGHPELYVFVTSAGSGSYGSLVGYASNRGQSVSEIFLPPLEETAGASKGYRGHDRFEVSGNRLVREYPLYRADDTNAQPTSGKVRRIAYRLAVGEASWVLRVESVSDVPSPPRQP